jgi:hypothetical protein
LAPGEYEVLAEGQTERKENVARFSSLYVDSGLQSKLNLGLTPFPELRLKMSDTSAGVPLRDAGIAIRRRDAAGEGPEVAVTSDRMPLLPGHWQITARPPAMYYLADINTGGARRPRRDPSPEWFEFQLDSAPIQAVATLSPQAGQISGRVRMTGSGDIAAPVYLLATTPLTRRQMNGTRVTQTDANGNYRFDGLAPGNYLLLSSFDLTEVNEETMLSGRAQSIVLEEGRKINQDLSVTDIP